MVHSYGMQDTDGEKFLKKKTVRSGFVVYVEAWVRLPRVSFR